MSSEDNLKILKCLGEETKYKIIKLLIKGEKCACEIPSLIGRKQSNTSMNLTKLMACGIIQFRKEGKKRLYYIKDVRVCDIFKALGDKDENILNFCSCMNNGEKNEN